MSTPEFALQHAASRKLLAQRAAAYALAQWARIDPADIPASWLRMVPELVTVLSGAQLAAAGAADGYVASAAAAEGVTEAAVARVSAAGFAGTAADGRALASLLYDPAIIALQSIKAGAPVGRALASGQARLDMIVRTEVADAGRAADQAALAAQKGLDGYVRIVVGKTCSRCTVLAGKWFRWNEGFNRHPRCDCIHLPSQQARATSLVQNPKDVYARLTPAERTKAGWTAADQKAIAEGANLNQVTNAQRGLYRSGGRELTRTNRQRITRRGPRSERLTPNQIFAQAKTRDEAIGLLRTNGYLVGRSTPAVTPAVLRDGPALKSAPASITKGANRRPAGMTDAVWRQGQFALREYRGIGFTGVNSQLRNPALQLPHVTTRIERMDRVMAASPLQHDVVLYRGIADMGRVFGSAAGSSLTGAQWTEAAYMSASTRLQQARAFADPGGATAGVMEIRVRAGINGVELSGMAGQAEMLLQRGLSPQVVEDRGIIDGMRYIVVEIP